LASASPSPANPVWRHFELFAGGLYEGRSEVELVVRMIASVGNYDYMIDWIFTQQGSIRVEVGLTGIDIPKGVRSTRLGDATAAADTEFGTLVAPRLVAPFHSTSMSTAATTASSSAGSRRLQPKARARASGL
jgi:primary-amine oxidase